MDNTSDKPFVCDFPGCNQRFANEDHLVSHSNKHELSLKLGGHGGTVLLVDQTPTPTRFLRNCEETGLFQELGNPFEQDFKHATGKIDSNNEVSNVPMPMEMSVSSFVCVLNEILDSCHSRNNSSSSDITLNSATQLSSASVPVAPPPGLVNPQQNIPLASAPAHMLSNSSAFAKQKLLETIQSKQQQQLQGSTFLSDALRDASERNNSDSSNDYFQVPHHFPRRRGRKPDEEEPEMKRQKFLERNRAAASRCRARKKQWVDGLERKSKDVELLNTSLQQEVIMLKAEVQQLKSIIMAHKDCPLMSNRHSKQDNPPARTINNNTVGVTLLSQLPSFSNLSPLVASSPSATLMPSPLFLSSIQAASHASSLDIGKNVEIVGDHIEQ